MWKAASVAKHHLAQIGLASRSTIHPIRTSDNHHRNEEWLCHSFIEERTVPKLTLDRACAPRPRTGCNRLSLSRYRTGHKRLLLQTLADPAPQADAIFDLVAKSFVELDNLSVGAADLQIDLPASERNQCLFRFTNKLRSQTGASV